MNKSQAMDSVDFGAVAPEVAATPVETVLSVLSLLERAPFRRASARTREMLIDLLVEQHFYDRALRHIGALARTARRPGREEIVLACSVRPPSWDPPEPPAEYEELDELDLEPIAGAREDSGVPAS